MRDVEGDANGFISRVFRSVYQRLDRLGRMALIWGCNTYILPAFGTFNSLLDGGGAISTPSSFEWTADGRTVCSWREGLLMAGIADSQSLRRHTQA